MSTLAQLRQQAAEFQAKRQPIPDWLTQVIAEQERKIEEALAKFRDPKNDW